MKKAEISYTVAIILITLLGCIGGCIAWKQQNQCCDQPHAMKGELNEIDHMDGKLITDKEVEDDRKE